MEMADPAVPKKHLEQQEVSRQVAAVADEVTATTAAAREDPGW